MAAGPVDVHAPSQGRSVVGVAFSGGRDSVALMHATACSARHQGLRVVALHVHHGLMPQADSWVVQMQAQIERWRSEGLPVEFRMRRLKGAPQVGDSVEAWARKHRYRALAEMARGEGIDTILLAQHLKDQAETVMLQALRGAGAAGWAAMPASVLRDGVWWIRPWLQQPRSAIESYIRTHRLRHVDDESNADVRFARARLRQRVWPALLEAFPSAEQTLAQAAQRLHEAQVCCDELAAQDLQVSVSGLDGGSWQAGRLRVGVWRQWSEQRRANVLRHWLVRVLPQGVPDSLVRRLVVELPQARGLSRWPAPGGELELVRGLLHWRARAHQG